MNYSEDWLSATERRNRIAEINKRFEAGARPVVENTSITSDNRLKAYEEKGIAATRQSYVEAAVARDKAKQDAINSYNALYNTLITECFMELFNRSIDYSPDQYDSNIARAYISNYIQNEGVKSVLGRMKTASSMLSEMASYVEGACKKHKDCDEDDLTDIEREEIAEKKYRISPEAKDEFFTNLKNTIDIEDVTQTIQLRVSNAMSDFINNNAQKKAEINDTIEQIKEKIDANTTEEVKEAYQQRANRRIDEINRNYQTNLFEKLVENLCSSVYTNDDAKRVFCENGKINMDKVIRHVKSVYSVLEIFNTTKLEVFNADKIQEIVESYIMK